jgi:hypothetical protein
MTLQELGLEYLEQEKVLRNRLQELRRQYEQQEDLLLRRRIYYLTQEATHCGKIGKYLLHYYEEEQNE